MNRRYRDLLSLRGEISVLFFSLGSNHIKFFLIRWSNGKNFLLCSILEIATTNIKITEIIPYKDSYRLFMWCWLLFSNFTRAFFLAVHQHVSLHPGPHYAIKGNSDILPICHVTGHPTPVVSWRKSSGQLPQGRGKYNNSALQILHVQKEDSDVYFCSASNLLGRVEKKTLLVVACKSCCVVKRNFKDKL